MNDIERCGRRLHDRSERGAVPPESGLAGWPNNRLETNADRPSMT